MTGASATVSERPKPTDGNRRKHQLVELGSGGRDLQSCSPRRWPGSLGKHLSPVRVDFVTARGPVVAVCVEWLKRGLRSRKLVCPPRFQLDE